MGLMILGRFIKIFIRNKNFVLEDRSWRLEEKIKSIRSSLIHLGENNQLWKKLYPSIPKNVTQDDKVIFVEGCW
jgi:hypothetical protein